MLTVIRVNQFGNPAGSGFVGSYGRECEINRVRDMRPVASLKAAGWVSGIPGLETGMTFYFLREVAGLWRENSTCIV